MMTLEDAAALARALPAVVETDRRGSLVWSVSGKSFAWERPFSKADVKRFGSDAAPSGIIVAVRVADLGEKEAVLAAGRRGVFTIPHFDGFAAVLVQLDEVTKSALRDALIDGWMCQAPAPLVEQYSVTALRRLALG
jgi:hypothetical protein